MPWTPSASDGPTLSPSRSAPRLALTLALPLRTPLKRTLDDVLALQLLYCRSISPYDAPPAPSRPSAAIHSSRSPLFLPLPAHTTSTMPLTGHTSTGTQPALPHKPRHVLVTGASGKRADPPRDGPAASRSMTDPTARTTRSTTSWMSKSRRVRSGDPTLFYIGSNVLDWPLEAQRGLADGHEICAHTWSHRYMTSLTNEQVFAEFYYSKKAIKDVLGVTVQCWRPPYSDVDDRVRYIANSLGMQTQIWRDNTFDYEIATLPRSQIEANYADIIKAGQNGTFANNGTIVLTHEFNNDTMSLMMENYPKIKAAFKNIVPVGVAYNNTQPYVEKEYTYPVQLLAICRRHTLGLARRPYRRLNRRLSLGPLSSGASGSISATVSYASNTATGGSAANAQSSGKSAAGRNVEGGVLGAVVAAVVEVASGGGCRAKEEFEEDAGDGSTTGLIVSAIIPSARRCAGRLDSSLASPYRHSPSPLPPSFYLDFSSYRLTDLFLPLSPTLQYSFDILPFTPSPAVLSRSAIKRVQAFLQSDSIPPLTVNKRQQARQAISTSSSPPASLPPYLDLSSARFVSICSRAVTRQSVDPVLYRRLDAPAL
ncbi:putative chitin deacetylase [Rhodotorula toruloides ATCC 204091]|uniref:chitin deacetylase n=1 Tax=Rhodotorula toruloides TaxID=5286 RepID=A0A2T0ACY5_RHOTO|nr:putative chitin deacetylase [Rhodotorula toruloides ATCC 204091]PRQ75869.1 putative chitin deacetylase [Rhodotorula toruloides]